MLLFFTALLAATEYLYTWEELHCVTNESVTGLVNLVKNYKNNFPCEECRVNFKKEVSKMEKFIPLKNIRSVDEARLWGWMIHNNVNIRTGNEWYPLEDFKKYPFENCINIYYKSS